jgi:hypothetical protein
MYRKEDVFNLNYNDRYELTELDKKIYEETGYVIHQVDYVFEYKQHFGTVYGQTVIDIHKDGSITGERWFFTNDDNKDFEYVELPENLIELARQKYEELINGYWKN